MLGMLPIPGLRFKVIVYSISSLIRGLKPTTTSTAQPSPKATATPIQNNLPVALPSATATATSARTSTPTFTATPGQTTANNTRFLRPNAQGSESGGNNNGFEISPAEAL